MDTETTSERINSMISKFNQVSLQNATPTTSLINLKLNGNEITSKITPAKDTDKDTAHNTDQSDQSEESDEEEEKRNKTRKAPNELLEEV